MSNVLHESKQQQVVALGRLGWSLRCIEAATGARGETISGYLTAAGVPVRRRGGAYLPFPIDFSPPDVKNRQLCSAPPVRWLFHPLTDS